MEKEVLRVIFFILPSKQDKCQATNEVTERMSRLLTRAAHLICLLLFSSCSFDSRTDRVVDDYEVAWIDVHEERALYKGEEIVPPYVFAVGHDSKYIFVKQHPLSSETTEKIDGSVVNYYIIERTKTMYQDKPKYGPLTKEKFEKKCIELGILNVAFDLEYPANF